ncbi:YceI family protein [Piscinibacter sp. XHJ-5]|uniref:YceI family protein n=1 Tax=Piscinibacter sp. XHJ-5 TaxID=3037797 RepID=UPI002453450D|nr:YceI family protein [Piscinibacter sp. XHJ-5]
MNRAASLLAAAAAAGLAHAQAVTYQVDPTHTFVTFEVRHADTSTLRGRFDRKEGSVVIDRQARSGTADIEIDVASVSTGVAVLDDKLQGKDFFNAAERPKALFAGDRFSFEGDKVTAVAGTLTLLGRSLPVTLKATHFNCYTNPLLKREVCGGDFEATILRSQWGMAYGVEQGLPDRIRLLIQIEAIRQ